MPFQNISNYYRYNIYDSVSGKENNVESDLIALTRDKQHKNQFINWKILA